MVSTTPFRRYWRIGAHAPHSPGRPMPIEITGTTTVHDGWGQFLIATVRLADGQCVTREIEHHGDAVAVLAYDPSRRTALLVRQLRAPMLYRDGTTHTLE